MAETLPPSELVELLRLKAGARQDVTFDYLGHLRSLRDRVAGEVRSINELFPEYTPHDVEYHLNRLFHVSDTLLERGRYEQMQATELFILACGLYAHDWGMAVSSPERAFITTGALLDGANADDFALVPNEANQFQLYLANRGLDSRETVVNGLSDEDWREYVRQTHAVRSAERVRRFFGPTDSGVAEAVSRVCEGHWLDFEQLQNPTRYPNAFSVLREPLNLAALAVYVRLVDLLDIASDRTPYVIWKFVAPRNPQSRMEWAKHRALQPVTCPPYQGGRLIRVDGSTDDHEVYAALEDLRTYCEVQVRGCTDLLARLNDLRHQLDLFHVEWRVAARGFDPIPVRFEFDRERVFEILSDEIYQGDAHVFLRELLQNSIDAIRTRREIFRRKRIAPHEFGLIRVDVAQDTDGYTRVVWSDNGVGMDAYVLRNYLAVAGKSFYRSDEFRRLGLAMDPISRFGIGILSCFMVADEVEIETCKEPYAPPPSEPLRVRIPSVTRQFRVERLAPGVVDVGTRITVHVKNRLLPTEEKLLQVTRYLKAVAGFVEFPILVSEGGKKTLILHPRSTIEWGTDPRFDGVSPEEIEIFHTPLGFPLGEAVVPQDLENAQRLFEERVFDLQADLGLSETQGQITFLTLRASEADVRAYYGGGIRETGVSISTQQENSLVRLSQTWSYPARGRPWSRSAEADPTHAIYRDGVLVAEARILSNAASYGRMLFPPRQVINLAGSVAPNLDVARSELRIKGEHWYAPISTALESKLREDLLAELSLMKGKAAFQKFGLFMASFSPSKAFFQSLVILELPFLQIHDHGRLQFPKWGSLGSEPVRMWPESLRSITTDYLDTAFSKHREVNEIASRLQKAWRGGPTLFAPRVNVGSLVPLNIALTVTRAILENNYHVAGVELLEPPISNAPPLFIEIWHLGAPRSDRSLAEIAKEAMVDPLSLSARDRAALIEQSDLAKSIAFVPFPDEAVTVYRTERLYNLRHPVAVLLLQSLAYYSVVSDHLKKWDTQVGRLRDAALRLTRDPLQQQHVIDLTHAASALGLRVDKDISSTELIDWGQYHISHELRGFNLESFGRRLYNRA